MAQDIFENGYLSVNSNVLSTYVQQMELSYEVETQDNTTMGDTTRSSIGGLKNWGLTVTFVQDFANGLLDAILFPLVGTVVPIEVRPDAGSVSTGNPKYTGYTLVKSYKPLGGSVGDLMTATLELVPAKSGANLAMLVRATS